MMALIIFNDGSKEQTSDLSREAGEWWYYEGNWYDYNPLVPQTPVVTASLAEGIYKTSQTVILSSKNSSDIIYYTTDGSIPTSSSNIYSSAITVSKTTTIKAIGFNANASTQWGDVAIFEYTIDANADLDAPVISANQSTTKAEISISGISFTITDTDSTSITAYYTTNGSEPTKSSTVYVSGNAKNGLTGSSFVITQSTTYRFLVVDNAGNQTTQKFRYTIGTNTTGDFREESIYFLMTARFFDGDSTNNRYCRADDESGNRANNDPPWRGDFKGLIEKLDYIKALGFSAVWITPPVLNRSDFDFHGYHAWDMTQVDPRLESTGATYQDLIDEVHKRGMKIIQDVVWNHSSRFGLKNFWVPTYWGDRDNEYWGKDTAINYYDEYNPNFEYNGLDVEPNSGKSWYNGDLWQKEKPSLSWNPDLSDWGKQVSFNNETGRANYGFQWPNLALFDPEKFHSTWLGNWENESCQTGSIHEDCIDLNTESAVTQKYLIDAYTQYIEMGVDAFRVDTVKHMSRNTLNRRYIPAFKAAGGDDFFMFGEVCTRVNEVWNHGVAPLSTPFYTWKERSTYSADDTIAAHEAYEYEEKQGPSNQPTSNNHLLDGNNYHEPDYSKSSGLSVIDFPMHWNFSNAGQAYNMRSNDIYYNDATWNVVYVDSHDYGPNTDNRYAGGTDAWAENMTYMWTFRGIPCLYYGSEIEFKAGADADKGAAAPLENTGRAYYGGNIEGTITTTDFGEWSNATGALAETMSKPLVSHVARLNKIRRAIPALQKGQYSNENCNGGMAFKRRYTKDGEDSFVLVTISGDATFTGLPGGTYVDVITGDTKKISEGGSITASCSGKGNARIYVLNGTGKIGKDTNWLK